MDEALRIGRLRPMCYHVRTMTSGRPFILALCALLLLGFALRVADLGADPPATLSWSGGPFTDGALVVHDARNKALFGEWIADQCRDIYFYPLANLAAYLVFEAAGTGRWQAALPGTLFGLLAIFLVAVALRRTSGPGPAVVFAIFATINYLMIMYDRLAMAEPAMILLMALAVVSLAAPGGGRTGRIGAGLFAAAAVLIGKLHAFYFPPALLLAVLLGGAKGERNKRKRRAAEVATGMAAALLLWLVFLGIPHGGYIFSQAGEASFEKHAHEMAAVAKRVWQNLFDMGVQTGCVPRMPVVSLLFVAGLLGLLARGRSLFTRTPQLDLLFLFWLVFGWISIAAQPTPPPRYLTGIAFPFLYFAARVPAALLSSRGWKLEAPRDPAGRAAWFVLLLLALYQPASLLSGPLFERLAGSSGGYFIYEAFIGKGEYFGAVVFAQLVALLLAVPAYHFLSRRFGRRKGGAAPFRSKPLACALIGAVLLIQTAQWVGWKRSSTYYLRDASRDIAESLGARATLVGPYAPALGLDNALPVYPFLGRYEDPRIFRDLAPTHMVIVTPFEKDAMESRYPEIAENWTFVHSYPIRMRYAETIELYRLSPSATGADYTLSLFERALERMKHGEWADAGDDLRRFAGEHPGNADGAYLLGMVLFQEGDPAGAIAEVERAVALRPGRAVYHYKLGEIYARLGRNGESLAELRTAHRLKPRDASIRKALDAMEGAGSAAP